MAQNGPPHNLDGFLEMFMLRCAWYPTKEVFIDPQWKLRGQGRSDAVVVVPMNYVPVERLDVAHCTTPSAPSEKSKSLGFCLSVVAVPNPCLHFRVETHQVETEYGLID